MHLLKFLPGMVVFFLCLGCSFAWGQVEIQNDNSFKVKSNNNNDNTVNILDGSIWIDENRTVKLGSGSNSVWVGKNDLIINTPNMEVDGSLNLKGEVFSNGLFEVGNGNGFKITTDFNVSGKTNFWANTSIRGFQFKTNGINSCYGSYPNMNCIYVPGAPTLEISNNNSPLPASIGTPSNRIARVWLDELYYHNKYQISDENYKEGVNSLQGKASINTIKKLNPVSFRYTKGYWEKYGYDSVQLHPDEKKYRLHRGFIAQEVKEVIPEIAQPVDSTGTMGLNQEELIPILTNAIQKQQKQIENLQQQLNDLQEQVDNGCCAEPE